MKYKKTKIILFVWVVIFVLMTSLFVFEFLKLKNTDKYTDSLEQEIAQKKESLQSFDSLIKMSSNIKADSEKINNFFIKRDEVVTFLDIVESLAPTTKTQISIRSVADKKTETGGALISININARGSYSNLHYLIRMLEELPYKTEIQNVRLSRDASIDEKGKSVNSWVADVIIVGVMI